MTPAPATASHPPPALRFMSASGHWIVGASADVTITRCVQDAVRPLESEAVQVMIVVPTGYGSFNSRLQGCPGAGWQSLSLRVPLIDTPAGDADGAVGGLGDSVA